MGKTLQGTFRAAGTYGAVGTGLHQILSQPVTPKKPSLLFWPHSWTFREPSTFENRVDFEKSVNFKETIDPFCMFPIVKEGAFDLRQSVSLKSSFSKK